MSKKPLKVETGAKILVRVPNWVGDALLATPAIHALRNSFPRAHIAVLAKPWVAPLFSASPDVDEIITYERPGRHSGLSGMRTLCRELRAKKFSLAVLLQNAFEAALIARWAGIPQRAGFAVDGRGLLLTHPVPIGGARKDLHHADYYLRLIESLGLDVRVSRRLRLTLPEESVTSAGRILNEPGPGWSDALLVGLVPGAQYGDAKRWLPERFAEVADRLSETTGSRTLVFGSKGEQQLVRESVRLMKTQAVDLSGRTTLLEAAALLARCAVVITNDSGLMHVASALSVPLVAIFGPTDPNATSPLGKTSRLVIAEDVPCSPCLKRSCPEKKGHACMKAVGVDEVLGEALGLIEAAVRGRA